MPESARPPLRTGVGYLLLGNGLLNACRFGIVALLAKAAGESIQGAFSFANVAIAGPVVVACGLELRSAFVADARTRFTFGTYRRLRALGMLIALAVTLAIVALQAPSAPSTAIVALLAGVCVSRVVFHVAEVDWGVYQRRERLDLLALANGARGLLLIAPYAVLVLPNIWAADPLSQTALAWRAAAAAWIGATLLALLWLLADRRWVAQHGRVDTTSRSADLPALARQTIPLGLVFLLIFSCDAVVQWIIKQRVPGKAGWDAVGYFGAMRYVALLAMFLIVQVGQAAGNRLAHDFQHDLRAFQRLAWQLAGAALAVGVALLTLTLLFGRSVLDLLFPPAYGEHYPALVVLMLGQSLGLFAAIFGVVATHMQQYWIQVPLQIVVLAITTLAALVLITPDVAVIGGAWAMVVRGGMQAVLYTLVVLWGIRARGRANRDAQPPPTGANE